MLFHDLHVLATIGLAFAYLAMVPYISPTIPLALIVADASYLVGTQLLTYTPGPIYHRYWTTLKTVTLRNWASIRYILLRMGGLLRRGDPDSSILVPIFK